jgi:hypothetical protein
MIAIDFKNDAPSISQVMIPLAYSNTLGALSTVIQGYSMANASLFVHSRHFYNRKKGA